MFSKLVGTVEPCPQVKCLNMQQTQVRIISLFLLLSLLSYFFTEMKTPESAVITIVESEVMNNACKVIYPLWKRYPQCTAVNVKKTTSPLVTHLVPIKPLFLFQCEKLSLFSLNWSLKRFNAQIGFISSLHKDTNVTPHLPRTFFLGVDLSLLKCCPV